MTLPTILAAKLPSVTLPTIRSMPSIPSVGCAGGDGTSYIGEQFGGLPDVQAALHLKALTKAINEQIYALLQGELPQPARAPVYAARAAQLAQYVVSLASTLNEVVGRVTGEATATINFINGKISEVNAAKAAIMSVPSASHSAAQRLLLSRYNTYASELNAQIARVNATVSCIGA